MSRVIRNAARCKKCDTVIESKSRHDFKSCPCGTIFVDGGLSYIRRGWSGGGSFEDVAEDLSGEAES